MTEKTEATPETDNKEVVAVARNTERLDRLSQIADRADEERAEDMGAVAEEAPEEVTEEVEEAPEAEDAAEEQAPVAKRKIKVNGKELELTEEEILARAQKVEAADQYLAEAAKIYKAYQEHHQLPAKGAEDEVDEDQAIALAIQSGDPEEIKKAIKKLKAAPPAPKADDLSKQIDDRLTFLDAANRFKEEYADILGDPILARLAIAEDQRLASEGDTRPYWDRYEAIGKELREWKKGLTKTTQLTEKRNRKAAVQSLPTASARASAPADNEPNDDPQSIIAQMAKRRGQFI